MIEPAHLWIPDRVGSYGDEAVDLAGIAGRELDEEQALAVDAILSYKAGGRWAALESAVVEARQNGKTGGVLLPVVLFDLFLLEPDRIVWTAHLFRTARDAFNDFVRCVDSAPELSRRVKKVTYANGEESIELHSGAKLEFLARSKGGGRGLGGKRVVMDEALILSAESMGALMPTLSARPDPQITYGSSAGTETSDHLYHLKNRGRAGGDPSLIWVEWCAPGSWEDPPCELGVKCGHLPGTQGCVLDDEESWLRANPTLGKRITVDYVRAERRSLPPSEFGRERLGWHHTVLDGGRPIDEKSWMDLVDIASEPRDPVALAIDVLNDRSGAAIGVAGRREDGLVHVEVIKSAAGVSWVVDDIAKLVAKWRPCAVALDDRSEAASLIPDLRERGLEVTREPRRGTKDIVVTTWANDLARACGQLYDAVTDTKTVRHLNQRELNESVRGATWRPLGDARAWSRKEATTNPAPLIAVTLALHGLLEHGPQEIKRKPGFAFA